MKLRTYLGKEIIDMRGEFSRGGWNPKTMNWNREPCYWWVNIHGHCKDFRTLKAAKEYIKEHGGLCPKCGHDNGWDYIGCTNCD